MNKYSAVQ